MLGGLFWQRLHSPALGRGQDSTALLTGTGTAVLGSWNNFIGFAQPQSHSSRVFCVQYASQE